MIANDIAQLIADAIKKAQKKGDLPKFDIPEIVVEHPKDSTHGDYATPVALGLARFARMAPVKIAEQIIKRMPETDYIVTTRGKNYVLVYIPTGGTASLNLDLCGWPNAVAWWYNCQTGDARRIGDIPLDGVRDFKPGTGGRGNDWVLVLDNAETAFPKPGGILK